MTCFHLHSAEHSDVGDEVSSQGRYWHDISMLAFHAGVVDGYEHQKINIPESKRKNPHLIMKMTRITILPYNN